LAKVPKNERVHHTTKLRPTRAPRNHYVAKDSDGNEIIGDLLVKKRNVESRFRGDRFFNVEDKSDDDDDEQDEYVVEFLQNYIFFLSTIIFFWFFVFF
jgi:hypothetical protein